MKSMANITLSLEEYQDILERLETLEEKVLEEEEDNLDEDIKILQQPDTKEEEEDLL